MSVNPSGFNLADGSFVEGDLLLPRLRSQAIVWNLVADYSDRFYDGHQTIKIPNNFDVAVTDWAAVPTAADTLPGAVNPLHVFTEDTLTMNQFKKVGNYIFDRNITMSKVDLFNSFLESTLGRLPEFMESFILTTAWNAMRVLTANYVQGPGTSGAFTIDVLDIVGQRMDEANIPVAERYAILAPQEYSIVKKTNAVRDASAFGSDIPVQNGIVGSFNGFILVNHNRLNKGYSLYLHRLSMAKGVQRGLAVARERQETIDADYVSVKVLYGATALRAGALIFGSGPEAFASVATASTAIKGGNS